MRSIIFFSLYDDMVDNGASMYDATKLEKGSGYIKYLKTEASPQSRASMKEWITDQAREYSNTPFNAKNRETWRAEKAAKELQEKLRLDQWNKKEQQALRKAASSRRRNGLIGTTLIAGGFGLGAYALSRRNNQQEES